MPNFQKDYMTMPDLAGNQWARVGGMLGRNRVTTLPKKKKQAPAANANPYVQAVNAVNPAPINNALLANTNKLAFVKIAQIVGNLTDNELSKLF